MAWEKGGWRIGGSLGRAEGAGERLLEDGPLDELQRLVLVLLADGLGRPHAQLARRRAQELHHPSFCVSQDLVRQGRSTLLTKNVGGAAPRLTMSPLSLKSVSKISSPSYSIEGNTSSSCGYVSSESCALVDPIAIMPGSDRLKAVTFCGPFVARARQCQRT